MCVTSQFFCTSYKKAGHNQEKRLLAYDKKKRVCFLLRSYFSRRKVPQGEEAYSDKIKYFNCLQVGFDSGTF